LILQPPKRIDRARIIVRENLTSGERVREREREIDFSLTSRAPVSERADKRRPFEFIFEFESVLFKRLHSQVTLVEGTLQHGTIISTDVRGHTRGLN